MIFKDLEKINLEELNKKEKQNFLPLFFLVQILDEFSLKNLKFDSEIAVVLLSRSFNAFFATRLTCTPDILLITTAVIKPERPSPTMHIRCLFILKILTLSYSKSKSFPFRLLSTKNNNNN